MLIGVIRTIALQVVGGNLAAGDIHHGRIAIEVTQAIELARQTVIENRCHMRALIGVEALALNDRGQVDDVVVRHLHTVALLDLGFAARKVKRLVLGLKLIEHGANHVIGRRRITQRISLGEQEALERVVGGALKEAIVVHVVGGLGLVEEVFLRDTVVSLGHTVGDLIDR